MLFDGVDRLTPQYIVHKYSIPLPSTLGVTPTPETPAQPLPLPLQTPTLVKGRGFEGVGVGVDVFLPWGYPCHSLPLWRLFVWLLQWSEHFS